VILALILFAIIALLIGYWVGEAIGFRRGWDAGRKRERGDMGLPL
jgi:hypothetical protein